MNNKNVDVAEIKKGDYIVRAIAADGQIRAFAATTRNMAETARKNHNTSPVVTAALGRLMCAGAMMGSMLKSEKDILTLRVNGSGPMKGMTITADANANVKGFAMVNDVMLPPNSLGKLDVGGAIGVGILSVIKDLGLKDPYVGQVALQTGEIAEDLTYYFATSEQVPSAVGLGVLMEKNNTVKQAGGFIIQLMPGVQDEAIEVLEKKLQEIPSVTTMLDKGMTPEDILDEVLSELDLEILDVLPTGFKCDCSVERIEKALISIGKEELDNIINDNKPIEIKCQFCNKAYNFSIEELKAMRDSAMGVKKN